jgi:ubiquinone/menaquinone biosynthesis C-methylase UbiE
VLFNGTANAIRRQAVPQLREVFAGRDQRKLKLLDIGSGTGRFLGQVKQVWPRLPCIGLDMSEAYIGFARQHLRRWALINFLVANAEAIPVADASCDAVTSIFMFHELPQPVRRTVFRECARILRPGGRFVLVDSMQCGDRPDYDGLLDLFPQNYHEPYYSTYITEDFQEIAKAFGLTYVRHFNAFVSKVMVFDKLGSKPF